jgi:hypothetical protein
MVTKALAGRFDNIVLTVNTIEATVKFYEWAREFEREVFQDLAGQPRMRCASASKQSVIVQS